jgi:hypothetical protein
MEGGDSVERVCGFESRGVWILAERCVFLVEEHVFAVEGCGDSNGRECGF